jgi:dTMP kinase
MAKPLFISVDGIDGSGKSTQAKLLVAWLQSLGLPVTPCVDPGGTELGAKIREILLFGKTLSIHMRAEALLFMASRAELVKQIIQPALARGEVVVSDRYLLANVVYQGHAGGLDVAELWNVGHFSTHGIVPDMTLVFDLPVSLARQRRNRPDDRMESRGESFDQKVRDGFLREAKERADRIHVIDASGTPEAIQAKVREIVKRYI